MKLASKLKIAYLYLALIVLPFFIVLFVLHVKAFHVPVVQSSFLFVVYVVFFCLLCFFVIEIILASPFENFKERIEKCSGGKLEKKRCAGSLPDEFVELEHSLDEAITKMRNASGNFTKSKELENLKFEFASIVSHQLRTPLSGLKWALKLAQSALSKGNKQEAEEMIAQAFESVSKSIMQVDILLQAVRANAEDFATKVEPLDIEEMVDDVVKNNMLFAKSKKIRIIIKKINEKIPTIEGSRHQLVTVFQILVLNSINYNHQKSDVTISLSYAGDGVCIKVADKGIGISQKEQKHIFSRFYRGKNAVKMHTSGSGVGLYVAKAIVENHGGELLFVSKVGKGTTFSVELPIKQKGQLETFIEY